MAHMGSLSNCVNCDSSVDPRGISLSGDAFGELADVIFNHDTMEVSYVVIDGRTGKFMLPADRIFIDSARQDGFVTDINNKGEPARAHCRRSFPETPYRQVFQFGARRAQS